MKKFKLRLRFTNTAENYRNPMNVILNDDINTSIRRCDISEENGEIVGSFTLDEEVSDTKYVYYRHDETDNIYHSIQLKDEPVTDKDTLTVSELRRK